MSIPNQPTQLTESERDLVRQGERTIDNLKRLFAVVFAVSFTVLGNSLIEKLRPVLTNPLIPVPAADVWLLTGEMVLVYLVTAGVFYHQSTKFLDIRYAKHPLTEAHPFGFALDYATLVLTAAPFFLMAHSLSPSVTGRVGFTWFFASYVYLISFGLLLLVVQEVRHLIIPLLREAVPPEEVSRERILRRYWLLMNSLILVILLLGFALARVSTPCPTSLNSPGRPETFLIAFGLIAIARDFLDYRYAWRFLYPIRPEAAERLDIWPLTAMMRSPRPEFWTLAGYASTILCFSLFFWLEFWNIPFWRSICQALP